MVREKSDLYGHSLIHKSLSASIMCDMCDISGTLIFVAAGQNVSGVVYKSKNIAEINKSFSQLRFDAHISAGEELYFQQTRYLSDFSQQIQKWLCIILLISNKMDIQFLKALINWGLFLFLLQIQKSFVQIQQFIQ
ncbi:Hypothetical_protein [Hexamita inflata]|uniref:Hypothetical_protein n=1 Tax=Hexamita inflata TaxID=28002 RepID=A0AA86P9A4_9EUKA|nr:Hypothetical protein HINF_LOCUS20993 [Hexamita inflata]